MEFIDTHCHLQFDKFRGRENEILTDAAMAGVKRLICPGTTLEDSQRAVQLAEEKDRVWAAAGVHPHHAGSLLADKNAAKKLKKIATVPRVVAIGETGLDYYRTVSAKEDQRAALRVQIETGLEVNLPFIFHVRDAWEDFWKIYDSCKNIGQIKGVVHSFSSLGRHLDEILARGLYVGLNGIMTFTKEHNQLEAARAVPANRLLLETDAPFLTPAPFRNEVCEPKHLAATADFLAELRGESLEELAKVTNSNAAELFGIDSNE